jgi:hypothetical protein
LTIEFYVLLKCFGHETMALVKKWFMTVTLRAETQRIVVSKMTI